MNADQGSVLRRGRRLTVLLAVLAAMPATAQQIKTEWGDWQYLKTTSALEVTEHLVLYGQTPSGTLWIVTRSCSAGVPVLRSKVARQGQALDLDRVYFVSKVSSSGRRDCWPSTGLCRGWRYKTRVRVDDLPIREWTWMYGLDTDGGWEYLWMNESFYSSTRFEGSRAAHSIDELLVGDRLAIEISASKGVAVFNTTGFAKALAEYCGGQKPYVYED